MQTIIELERTAAAHWRGTEEQWLGDWLLRAAEGFTGRANSVLPLGFRYSHRYHYRVAPS